jgi:hypothetical protein
VLLFVNAFSNVCSHQQLYADTWLLSVTSRSVSKVGEAITFTQVTQSKEGSTKNFRSAPVIQQQESGQGAHRGNSSNTNVVWDVNTNVVWDVAE